jgi:hypothetical protein
MADQISFTITGSSYKLSRDQVMNSVKGIEPQKITKYAVKIGSKRYPPKQVLAEALNIPAIAFTTQYAYNILHRLDFEVEANG